MRELRRVILEYLTRRSDASWDNVRRDVGKVARERGLVAGGTPTEPMVDRILWDLIVERLLSLGSSNGQAEARYPFLYITEMGKVIASGQEHLYDPDEYVASLKRRVPTLDSVVSQYLLEAVGSFQRGLLFGAAVLCGAAAEREILLLLTAIEKWDPDPNRKTQAQSLLQRPRLPSIFSLVDGAIKMRSQTTGCPTPFTRARRRTSCLFRRWYAYKGTKQQGAIGVGPLYIMLLNAHHEPIHFVLPAYRSNAHWQALLDTSNTFGQPPEGFYFAGKAYPLQGRALALLIAAEKR